MSKIEETEREGEERGWSLGGGVCPQCLLAVTLPVAQRTKETGQPMGTNSAALCFPRILRFASI